MVSREWKCDGQVYRVGKAVEKRWRFLFWRASANRRSVRDPFCKAPNQAASCRSRLASLKNGARCFYRIWDGDISELCIRGE
jgi:hypothetical protein